MIIGMEKAFSYTLKRVLLDNLDKKKGGLAAKRRELGYYTYHEEAKPNTN
jgi:hypothetical protein